MTNPTDTNQASEDSLRYVLRHTKVTAYAAGKPYVVNLATVIQKEDIDAIQAIIRTEKLKLLAEVRERVIGQDVTQTERHWSDEYGDYCGKGKTMIKGECICEELNGLKAEQRDILTKLEAEL